MFVWIFIGLALSISIMTAVFVHCLIDDIAELKKTLKIEYGAHSTQLDLLQQQIDEHHPPKKINSSFSTPTIKDSYGSNKAKHAFEA